MAVHVPGNEPVIPGYAVRLLDGDVGGLVAERLEELTEYQIQYGCAPSVIADSPRELEWLCMAERVKAELVDRAERAMREDQYPVSPAAG
jgi:hypothetical protein